MPKEETKLPLPVVPEIQEPTAPVIPPKKPKKKFAIVLLVFLFLALGLCVYLLFSLDKVPQKKTLTQNSMPSLPPFPSIFPSMIPSMPAPTVPLPDKMPLPPITTWKTYQFSYGGYEIDYPDTWTASECPSGGGFWNCINFNVLDKSYDKNKPFMDGMISVGDTDPTYTKPGDIVKEFKVYGLKYQVKVDTQAFQTHGYFLTNAEEIAQKMADSVRPLEVVSTCTAPALVPLKTFPDNFTLSTYHDSDGKDPVESYWPYTPNVAAKLQPVASSPDTNRGFMVNYVKSGEAFSDSSTFSKTVTPIIGTKDSWGGFEKNTTAMWHMNCVNTQEDGPGMTQPYYVRGDNTDIQPFAVDVYGKASNPTALWSKDKWNVNLLKTTRNEVYIKQNGTWQKYSAVGYYATMPTVYGGKPAIYLYPPKTERVQVEIHPQGSLIKTDSLYNSKAYGWEVAASPNGRINNSLDYLYYEALLSVPQPDGGYVIPFRSLFTFSKDYVKELGLTESEANEFISFWKTKLPESPYYFVSNLTQQTISEIYPLTITPKPDVLLRVELYFKPLKSLIQVPFPRKENPVKRSGFTAVEWGAIFSP
ncbi:MAG: hypothetical protein ACM3IJ_03110 [Candidatus Levyibacteriota bacterium]